MVVGVVAGQAAGGILVGMAGPPRGSTPPQMVCTSTRQVVTCWVCHHTALSMRCHRYAITQGRPKLPQVTCGKHLCSRATTGRSVSQVGWEKDDDNRADLLPLMPSCCSCAPPSQKLSRTTQTALMHAL